MSRHIAIRRTAMAAALSAAFSIGALVVPAAAHAAAWSATATQAMPLKNVSGATPLQSNAPMHIAVAMNMRNKPQLDAFVAGMGKPGSASFGKVLTPQQFLQTYAPTSAQTSAVMSYLTQSGFTNLKLSDNNMSITADGTAAVVQKAFNTQIVQFSLNGKNVFANSVAAQVPASLGGSVAAVLGLHNINTTQTLLAQNEASGKVLPKIVSGAHTAAPSAPGTPQISPELNASAFQTAYDAAGTTTGWGTTIGIITEGDISQVPVDLRQYEKENSLPQVPYEIDPTGPQTTDASGIDEWDLDSQTSSGIAGNLKKIIFYNAGSLADIDLLPAFQKVVSEDRVKAVNMSFGGCEALEGISGGLLAEDLAYEQGGAEGITFFASTGDAGAACGLVINLGLPDTGIVGAVEYPSSSPYVVAVGGTTLLIDSTNTYIDELAWDAGGGGNSLLETAPTWQAAVVPLGNAETALRGTPDVSMDADNNLSPALVVVSGADEGVGGTSLSSPLSVGTWARMQTAHGNCYGFAAPIFYGFAGSTYLTAGKDFHDVIAGTNGLYVATPGWDYTTGIGSFDITKVNADLPPISCLPAAPDSLTAGVVSGQVLLSWSAVAGATSYAVFDGTAAGAEGATPIATTSNNSTVVKLAGGSTYFLTVKAVNAVGSSPASNEASVAVPLPPAAPTNLIIGGSNGGFRLSWSGVTGATGYEVLQGTAAGKEGTVPVVTGITSTNTTISGLTTGSTYYFTVKAVNAGGEGAASNEVNGVVAVAPAAPTNIVAVTGTTAGTVKLNWKGSAGTYHYNVYQGTTSDGESATPVVANTQTPAAVISGLVSGKTYYFQVTGLGSYSLESGKSQEASAPAK